MFFSDSKVFETEVAGRKLTIETGKMAQLANGACLVRYGETEVLCTATMADKPREGVDFFPETKPYFGFEKKRLEREKAAAEKAAKETEKDVHEN